MYDTFIELVEHQAWDMALEFVSERYTQFKTNLEQIPEKKKKHFAQTLERFIEHVADPVIKELYQYEFQNFIFLHLQPRSQYTVQMYRDDEKQPESICIVCLEPFQHNDMFVHCKICSKSIGHYLCCDSWFKALYGTRKPSCPKCALSLSSVSNSS
jgi:protoheme ferro-lyase